MNFSKSNFRFSFLFACLAMVGIFFTSCEDEEDDLRTTTYPYAFNTGQVGAGTAYDGTHPASLTASLTIAEMEDNMARVTVLLTNTVDGETYNVHAHDAADPATTPNNTPYNETPNSNVLVQTLTGNGGDATASQISTLSYEELTTTYEAFFVVHDPLQPINTADISTYLVVGSFARD